MAEREPHRWITVKGAHIPIYLDEHGNEVFGVGQEQKEKSALDMNEDELRDYIKKNLIDENSYFKSPEYNQLQKYSHEVFETSEKLKDEWLAKTKEAEKEIDQDSYNELVEMFDGDKRLARELADKTPKGRKLQDEANEAYNKYKELEATHKNVQSQLAEIKQQHSREQYVEFVKEYQSGNGYKPATKEEDYRGFQFNTGVPYYEELKSKGAHIVEMTPKQYLQECAHRIFKGTTYENQILVGMADTAVLKDLMKKMQGGTKMYLPYLNYEEEQQEGRHRAMAAMLLGIEKIPVLVMNKKKR